MKITWNGGNWTTTSSRMAVRAGGARRGAGGNTDGVDILEAISDDDRITVAGAATGTPTPAARRGGEPALIDVSVETGRDESAVLAVRHPSGALTFHRPAERIMPARRGATATQPSTLRFRVPVRPAAGVPERRGFVTGVVKTIVLKVAGAVADALLPTLALRFEQRTWKNRGLAEGWLRVDAGALKRRQLSPAVPDAANGNRSLLLLHGTFSNTAGAFHALSAGTFFARVAPIYGDRIFGFDHFSLGRTPEENARMLVEALPAGRHVFDVVTHSRGGLVLRNLVERADSLGAAAKRFELVHAVLVASPNDGTPLATPRRWDETVGWVANLFEKFPDNPLTFGAEWVAEGIVWLAHHASGGIPGLHSMDTDGDLVRDLQRPPGPSATAYSALASNFEADATLLARFADVGLDGFFNTANDLVVPTEGGWRVDRDGAAHVPADRIGCFGVGGNLAPGEPAAVHHLNFFARPETVDFILNAVTGAPQRLAGVDLERPLPDRRFFRAARAEAAAPRAAAASAAGSGTAPGGPTPTTAPSPVRYAEHPASPHDRDSLHLMILKPDPKGEPYLLATYCGARVLEPFPTSGTADDAGKRFQEIIAVHDGIRGYIDGEAGGHLPDDEELIAYGELLFRTLFPAGVRRLYDRACSLQNGQRLDVVFTSMIPWVADKPWEFAFDPARRTFLATEEIHFLRNVLTSVPADAIAPTRGPLRILVVVAQPVGAPELSLDEEVTIIRRGFEPLVEAGLARVDVLPRATPGAFHRWISTDTFDVVHFVGHGEFDVETERGYLIFEDEEGAVRRLNQRAVREILCQRGIRLIFLNACETGRGGRADFNRGVAQQLVAGGVPAVVANQYKVLDASATTFAQHFYWSLAQGMPLGIAAREARVAVNYRISGETIDWAVPVLYARDPNARFCEAPAERRLSTPLETTRQARRSTRAHAVRIAVWDVNHVFPRLEATLERLNAAQDRFGFELVDLSAPIGTWRVNRPGERAGAYLNADDVARRLRHMPAELGVAYLACVTNLWMHSKDAQGNEIKNSLAWWPTGTPATSPGSSLKAKLPPVLLFSTAGLGPAAHGPLSERIIANALVTGISGARLRTATHPKGSPTCPLYRNPKRLLAVLSARHRFDDDCRRRMNDAGVDDLTALERLLETFDTAAEDETDTPAPKRPRRRRPARPTAQRPPRARRVVRKKRIATGLS